MLENEILLIGIGKDKNNLNKIVEAESLPSVAETYGSDSVFYKALSEIYRISSAKVDILNLEAWEDLKEHEDVLIEYEYDYVVPLDLYLEEEYFDEFYETRMTYSQLLLLLLSNTISTIVVTGKHASNFENLDAYLDYERENIESAEYVFSNLKRENIIYVGNILKDYSYANTALAAMLVNTDYAEYPRSSMLGEAYFDIDYADISNKLVYFKNNYLENTTVENLINFSDDGILRLVPVYKIIKYFYCHHADVDQYIGKAYTDYALMKILEKEQAFLNSCVGWLIYDYEILSITPKLNDSGAISILFSYNIWPKFTTEKYTIEFYL